MMDLKLHPEAAHVMEVIAAQPDGGRPFHELSPEQAREGAAVRMPLLNIDPEPVGKIEERTIPGPAGPLPIRVYTPLVPQSAGASGHLPVFVHFHGGAFVVGGLESHDPQCRYWSNHSGCMVVSVDYRLSPENKFPAAYEDCEAATAWIAEHGAEIGCDPNRIAIGGESAGSNLAAAICQTFRDQGGPKICLQLLCVPCLDFSFSAPSHETFAYGYSLGRPLLEWTRTHYLRGNDDIADRRASPLVCSDLENLPAAAFFTAGYDPLRDEGRAYADRLARAGVDVEYTCYEGLPHGFVGWGKSSSRAVDYLNDCADALRRAFL